MKADTRSRLVALGGSLPSHIALTTVEGIPLKEGAVAMDRKLLLIALAVLALGVAVHAEETAVISGVLL